MTLALLFSTLLAFQAQPQAADQDVAAPISAVTVFQRGAQVTREADVQMPAGTTRLRFAGLTPDLDPGSIQFSATGAVTVLSVVHRTNYLEEASPSEEAAGLQTRMEALQDSLRAEEMLLDVYEQEEALLLQNMSIGGTTNGVDVGELRAAADFLRTRLTEIKRRQRAIQQTIERLREAIAEVDSQLGEIAAARPNRATSEITATLTAAAPVQSELALRYLTSAAGWAPRYDVRVEDVGGPIALAYNANVSQRTGEDWADVRLTLSTGDPAQPGTIPELRPWRLGFYRPRPARPGRPSQAIPGPPVANPRQVSGRVTDLRGEALPGVNVVVDGTSVGAATDRNGAYQIELPPNAQQLRAAFVGYQSVAAPITSDRIDFRLAEDAVALDEVVVTSDRSSVRSRSAGFVDQEEAASLPVPVQQVARATTVEFAIDVPYTIPTDGKPYAVQVEDYEVPAAYRYYAAPKLDEAAYLTALVTGWERLNLLSGPANLFFEGTYVGESFLDVAATADTLTVSLGQDRGVVVRRTKQRDFSDRSFFGRSRSETVAFETEIRNTKARPIEIVVEDQIPLSTTDQIDVEHELGDGATLDEETGLVRWRLTVPPQATEDVAFRYTVQYPSGERVVLE